MQIYEKTASFPIKTEGKMYSCPKCSNKTFFHDSSYRCHTSTSFPKNSRNKSKTYSHLLSYDPLIV